MMTVACVGVSLLVLRGAQDLTISERRQRVVLSTIHVSRMIELGRLPRVLPAQDVDAIQVVDDRGNIVSATAEVAHKPLFADLAPPVELGETHRLLCEVPGFPGQCLHVEVLRHYRPTGDWLIYGAGRTPPWHVSLNLVAIVVGGSLLLVALTAFGTYHLVRKTLAPVDDVCKELAEITASDLSRRVPLSGHRDEMRNLAETVNQTLDRLQQAVERQRRFASDAGHDLRSPITAMRAQVEEALLHPDETDWTKIADALIMSLDRLQAIVNDLLVIARLDSGEKTGRDYINLAELVRKEVGRRFRGKRIMLDLQQGVVVSGDRLQLLRLLTNLLDNAERHAASTVTLLARREGADAVLEVIDDGEGIAPEHRETIFQRFTRLPSAVEKDKQGTGLGLAIARDVARQHSGTLDVEDSPRGARFVLRIPVLTLPQPANSP